jgi:hypothetical protein
MAFPIVIADCGVEVVENNDFEKQIKKYRLSLFNKLKIRV